MIKNIIPTCGGLSTVEVKYIEELVRDKEHVLEWGSGHSTLYFSKCVKHWYSIEHDMEWYTVISSSLKKYNIINVDLYYVPNNMQRSFPHSKKEEFENYINFVHNLHIPHFDVVFIDGRARNWCAVEVLKYCNEYTTLLIHDWDRPKYHEVLDNGLTLLKVVDKLAILQKSR